MHARRGGKSRSKTIRSLCGGLSGIMPCLHAYILARGHREHKLTHGKRNNVVNAFPFIVTRVISKKERERECVCVRVCVCVCE